MKISMKTREALTKLGDRMLAEPDLDAVPFSSIKAGRIPERMRDDAGESEWLTLDGEDYWLYRNALVLLNEEPNLEHIAEQDIEPELWDFCCEAFVKRDEYRNHTKMASRVAELLAKLKKPWKDFEILAVISHLNVTADELVIGDVRLCPLTAQFVAEWGLRDGPYLERMAAEITGKTAAVTREKAGSSQRAAERAKNKIDDALSTLRFALSGAIRARIPDNQMLFRREELLAVKPVDGDTPPSTSWELGYRPMGVEVPIGLAETLREYLAPLEAVTSGDISKRLASRIRRAIHWIGTSATRESHDDKVIDLCTALETLITTKDDKRKGQAIALRSMLLPTCLGGGFLDPTMAFRLYDVRSQIIHGSDVRISGDQHSGYLHALAIRVLSDVVRLLQTDSSLTKQSKIISHMESPERLRDAISWLEQDERPEAQEIRKFAETQLAARAED